MGWLVSLLGPLWSWLGGIAVVASILGYVYFKGHHDGATSVQAKWDAAIQRSITDANEARDKAEHSVPADPTPAELCKSKWNRNPC